MTRRWQSHLRPVQRGFAWIVFALCPAFATLAADPPTDVEFTPDIVYGKGGDQDLKLNLAKPKEMKGKLPCIAVIHGGGWAGGNRDGHNDLTWQFAHKGYVSVTIGYRLAPDHKFPAQVNDVKCAIRFLRANAEKYGIDPDHIGAVGFSAGGHLSMMLGLTSKEDGLEGDGGSPDQSSKVQAVVSFFGPTDLMAPDLPTVTTPILETFIGGTPASQREAYEKASPIHFVTHDDAPMLLFQGTADPLVPYSQAVVMAVAMHRAGVPGRVELLPGLGHGWGGADLKYTFDATLDFFAAKLKADAAKGADGQDKKE